MTKSISNSLFITSKPTLLPSLQQRKRSAGISASISNSLLGSRRCWPWGIQTPQAVACRALPAATGVSKCSTSFSPSQQQPLTTGLQQITENSSKTQGIGSLYSLGASSLEGPQKHRSDVIFGIASLQTQQCLAASLLYAVLHKRQGGSALG